MKVKELLSSPDKWTQGSYARNKEGEEVASVDNDAVCWCLSGAIARCYWDSDEYMEANIKLTEYIKSIGWPSIPNFNDNVRSFDEVREILEILDI